MQGHIKLGKLWWPFRATEELDVSRGFIWEPRVGYWPFVIEGEDKLWDGQATTTFRFFGFPLASGGGDDVKKSNLGRMACECCLWCPTLMTPQMGAQWKVGKDGSLKVGILVCNERVWVDLVIGEDGQIKGMGLTRYGDIMGTGWRYEKFGGYVDEINEFAGGKIGKIGNGGWFWEQERYKEGEFFRFTITTARFHKAIARESSDA